MRRCVGGQRSGKRISGKGIGVVECWGSGLLEYWETPGTAAVHPSFHHSSFHGRSWFVRSLGTKHIRTSVLRAKTPVRPASWRPAAPAAGRPVFRSSRCAVIIASTSTFGHHGTGERVTAPMSGRPRHQCADLADRIASPTRSAQTVDQDGCPAGEESVRHRPDLCDGRTSF